MSKIKTNYRCTNCGHTSSKWEGKCASCQEWNTYQEEIVSKETKQEKRSSVWSDKSKKSPVTLNDIQTGTTQRIVMPDSELNRVLGGGLVLGSLVLVGGQPGIGKSTLLLQISLGSGKKVLYVTGEESEEQIKMRANRLQIQNDTCFIFAETNVDSILNAAKQVEPHFLIIDSIQTLSSPHLESTPGSVSQVRECASQIAQFTKETHIPVIIVGHITKDGSLAGPKLLEHMVDVVLQFEGDHSYAYRILRTQKNRYGSTDELGIYEMQGTGLLPVANPSELLLSQSDIDLSGSAIAATMEGLRPMLIECQALVSKAIYGTPQRSATGFDLRRLSMILAVLEKRCGLPFGMNDVFLNLAGGIKISDPSIDLAIVVALISSLQDLPVDRKSSFAGEVGLSGEVRAVSRIEQRIQEANRLGFEKMYVSKHNTKGLTTTDLQIELIEVSTVEDLMGKVFA